MLLPGWMYACSGRVQQKDTADFSVAFLFCNSTERSNTSLALNNVIRIILYGLWLEYPLAFLYSFIKKKKKIMTVLLENKFIVVSEKMWVQPAKDENTKISASTSAVFQNPSFHGVIATLKISTGDFSGCSFFFFFLAYIFFHTSL